MQHCHLVFNTPQVVSHITCWWCHNSRVWVTILIFFARSAWRNKTWTNNLLHTVFHPLYGESWAKYQGILHWCRNQLSSGNQWENGENANNWTKDIVNVRMTVHFCDLNRGKMHDISAGRSQHSQTCLTKMVWHLICSVLMKSQLSPFTNNRTTPQFRWS